MPVIDDASKITPAQTAAAAYVIDQLGAIPGRGGECHQRLHLQETEFRFWGEELSKVEQARCGVQVQSAVNEAEGIPWWGFGLGAGAAGLVGIVIGFVIGFSSGVQ